ncbi:MAG: tRNA (N6-isopentenyl adenosine(37)-C2)-methylthiotransferase MiaB [Eubacteriales bacterium]
MANRSVQIPSSDILAQLEYCKEIKNFHKDSPLAFVDTYGCQQNEADSQKIRGYLEKMGYAFTNNEKEAQIIVINTCAIRDHAEQKIFGNVGALVHSKKQNPNQLICLCGCMMQQEAVAERIKKSFRHVDLVFGPQVLWRFPEFIHRLFTEKGRIFQIPLDADSIAEGLPQVRQNGAKGWLSIMYGCNNYCTYCIVPYVRGRERSRQPEEIVAECQEMIDSGIKEITLLGQNVNSYGKDLETPLDFSDLLQLLNKLEGDFLLRFMTSHPKDATEKLFETMASCDKVAPSLHLPFQSGNNQILKAMNRGYTQESYLEKITQVKKLIPNITLTSDVIVGFPEETREQFQDTLKLLEIVEFDALFTFIFSPRSGTPAAKLPDPVSKEEKSKNFQELLDVQNKISGKKHQESVGQIYRCLVDGESGDLRYPMSARTPGNRLLRFDGDPSLVGQFVSLKVTEAGTWSLTGELVKE